MERKDCMSHFRLCTRLLALLLVLSVCPVIALGAEITIDDRVRFEDGNTTITWTDDGDGGPYALGYECLDNSGMDQGFWASGNQEDSTTSSRSYTFPDLVPGYAYTIYLFGNEVSTTANIQVPSASTFEDGLLKASSVKVSLGYRTYQEGNNSPQKADGFTASDMNKHMSDTYYGLYYELSLPRLSHARDYNVLVTITAPNGFVMSAHSEQYVFSTGVGFTHFLKFMGSSFFDFLMDRAGEIPVGTYTVNTYFNGMIANTQTFRVR